MKIEKLSNCTGCGSCMQSCPVHAIQMNPNTEGFLYPKVNKEKCIKCNKCEKKCPALNYPKKFSGSDTYAVYNKNFEVRKKSTSGGVFSLLAEYVLKQHGSVYGAAYDENFNVVHQKVLKLEDLEKLRGTKYIQSYSGHFFKEIEDELKNNKEVLFSGTPCQVAGLKAYLGKEYKTLLCVDLICHSVPSPLVWRKWLDEVEKKEGAIEEFCFRNKITGWKKYSITYKTKEQNHICTVSEMPFMQGFLHNLTTRNSCSECSSKGIERCSDITLGDFWGIEEIEGVKEIDDDIGLSAVVVHSEKARDLFEKLNEFIVLRLVKKEDMVRCNPCVVSSVKNHKKRNQFFRKINQAKYVNVDELIMKMLNDKPDITKLKEKLFSVYSRCRKHYIE